MAIAPTNRLVIQLRRDYSSHWEKYKNVVPAIGEPCYVIDKNLLKIGDGITKVCDLKPINGVEISVTGDDQSIIVEGDVFKLVGYDTAEIGAQPQRTANGIEWITPVDYSNDIKDLQDGVDAVQSDMKTLQDDVTATLSQVESAVRAIEVVEF